MARILVFSDVHANLEALDAIFTHARGFPRPDQVWCLGDLVGYGPSPGECIDRIRQGFEGIPITCIRGNHDEGVIRLKDGRDLSKMGGVSANIRQGWDWTARNLTNDQINYLRALPKNLVVSNLPQSVLLVHAAPPDDLETYLLAVRTIEARLPMLHQRICCFGHTHLPSYFSCDLTTLQVKPRLLTQSEQRAELHHADRLFLNPGSVGQPRWGRLTDGITKVEVPKDAPNQPDPYPRKLEGVPKATYCWLDLEPDQIAVTFHAVAYDVATTLRKLDALASAADRLEIPERWRRRLELGLR